MRRVIRRCDQSAVQQVLRTVRFMTGHSRTLLAQFGLTPKSKRGLAAREVGMHTKPLAEL
jgi:hypothetical protein